jgi:ribose transport system substrate-binding protein
MGSYLSRPPAAGPARAPIREFALAFEEEGYMLKFRNAAVRALIACCLLLGVLGISACGSASTTSSSASKKAGAGADAQSSAKNREAQTILAPYLNHPSAFPVTTPLKSPPPSNTTIAYMDCSTPVCGEILQALKAAAATAGVRLDAINAGDTASSLSAAFGTVITTKPGAVIVPGIDPSTWGASTISNLKKAGIPIIGIGYVDGGRYGLDTYPDVVVAGPMLFEEESKLEAAYIASHYGPHAKVAFATVPGLSFSDLGTSVFTSELRTLCPGCTVNTFSIQTAHLGSTAPQDVVSYLQAHSGDTVLASVDDEAFDGLTTDLNQVSIKIPIVSRSADPLGLEALKAGDQQAVIEEDIPVVVWESVDASLRAVLHQPFTAEEKDGIAPIEVLEPQNITFNPKNGWTGYPNFAKMFAKLWK